MESSVAPLPRRPSHRTYRSLLHHLCSSFDREPRISLATPALLQELVLRIEIALESPGETEKPPENLLRSDGGCGDSRAEKVEMISKELMLGDVFDGIDYHQITDGEEKRQKKKKRRRKKDKDLDEDDYLLLEDHNVKFQKRKFKRLKKDGGNGQGGSSDDELDGSGGARKVAEEMIKDYLFDDVDGGEEELAAEEDVVGSEDEMADFIVDEDGVGPSKRGSHSSAIREALEIFGCPKKFRKKSSVSSDWTELKRRLDPCEKYSDAICQLDIPERMQMFLKSTGSPPIGKISIEEESNWIYARLIFTGQGFSVNKDDIANFLELHHVQKFEIPFIATYRKKQCRSLLGSADGDDVNLEKRPGTKWHKVCWMIQDLDREWLLLQKRKIALHGYYTERFEKDRRVYDETRPNLNQCLLESVIKSLKRAETERELDDVDSMLKLHFPRADEGQNKEPKRKSKYSICSKAGIWQVANKFGYSVIDACLMKSSC